MGGLCSRPAANEGRPQGAGPSTAGSSIVCKGADVPLPPVDKSLQMQKSILGRVQPEDVRDHYTVGKVLGAGQFGITRLVVHKDSGKQYACKSLSKLGLGSAAEEACLRQELQILYHVSDHPHIVSVVEAFEDHSHIHLIMELAAGGDLIDSITCRGTYTEKDAAAAVRKILEVVAFCHDMGVVHRDLKLDNFLLADETQAADAIRACDFGLSTFFKPGQRHKEVLGTAFYIAPEVLMMDYDEKVDVWAAGVILYILLSGRPPFDHVKDEDIFKEIMEQGKPDMTGSCWRYVSEPAKDCVRKMMTWDAKERPSAREMLNHEWVRADGVAGDNVLEPEVLQRLRSFATMNQLKKHALMFMAQHMSEDEVQGLKELFRSMDTDGDGTISMDELRQGLSARGVVLPDDLLANIMDMADVNHNRVLDYEEWVAGMLHMCQLQKEERLREAFQHFDTDGDGYITRDELQAAFASGHLGSGSLDTKQTLAEVQQVLQETDADNDGKIDYKEFSAMMLASQDNCKAAAGGPRGAAAGGGGGVRRRRSSAEAFAVELAAKQADAGAGMRDQGAAPVLVGAA